MLRMPLHMAYPTYTPHCWYYAEIAMFLSIFPSYVLSASSILPQGHTHPTELVRGNGSYSDPLNYLFFCSAHASTWSSTVHSSSAVRFC